MSPQIFHEKEHIWIKTLPYWCHKSHFPPIHSLSTFTAWVKGTILYGKEDLGTFNSVFQLDKRKQFSVASWLSTDQHW